MQPRTNLQRIGTRRMRKCRIHDRPLECLACVAAKGGKSKSAAKVRAAKKNAKKGGRPRND